MKLKRKKYHLNPLLSYWFYSDYLKNLFPYCCMCGGRVVLNNFKQKNIKGHLPPSPLFGSSHIRTKGEREGEGERDKGEWDQKEWKWEERE